AAHALWGKPRLPHRAVVTGTDPDDLLAGLQALAAGEESAAVVTGTAHPSSGSVFVFPGQGSQWVGMGRDLYNTDPTYRTALDAAVTALADHLDTDLYKVLRPNPDDPDATAQAERDLERVDVVQPALFAVMTALAAYWQAHGIAPDAVIGHSQGEIAAAYVAGALTLPDAARIVALRAKALTTIAGTGGMLALQLPQEKAAELLTRTADHPGFADLSIATVNGPTSTVISGDASTLQTLHDHCQTSTIDSRLIPVDYASHSAHVETLQDDLAQLLAPVQPRPATIPFYSTLTGTRIDDTTTLTADYWYQNLRHTVALHDAITKLATDGHTTYLECSPHPVLTTPIADTLDAAGTDEPTSILISLRRNRPDAATTALATAVAHGLPADLRLGDPGPATPPDLPTYAFSGRNYWLTTPPPSGDLSAAGLSPAGHPLLATMGEGPDGTLTATGTLRTTTRPWIPDHAVDDTVLLPATALLDLALYLGQQTGHPQLDELTLHAP
ncbi:MAG: acyltransferase domain-containing protein, partial [Frankia sp.]